MINYRKNSKKGFTLAEVSLALVVVGILAVLTIPTLCKNIQDAQFRTSFKAMFSEVDTAVKLLAKDNGGMIEGICGDFNNVCLANKLSSYLNYQTICANNETPDCGHFYSEIKRYNGEQNTNMWYFWTNYPVIKLNNGTQIYILSIRATCLAEQKCQSTCGILNFDLNGSKGPNVIGRDIYLIYLHKNFIESACTPSGIGSVFDTCRSQTADVWGEGSTCGWRWLLNLPPIN